MLFSNLLPKKWYMLPLDPYAHIILWVISLSLFCKTIYILIVCSINFNDALITSSTCAGPILIYV